MFMEIFYDPPKIWNLKHSWSQAFGEGLLSVLPFCFAFLVCLFVWSGLALTLEVLLPLPPEWWDYRLVPTCWLSVVLLHLLTFFCNCILTFLSCHHSIPIAFPGSTCCIPQAISMDPVVVSKTSCDIWRADWGGGTRAGTEGVCFLIGCISGGHSASTCLTVETPGRKRPQRWPGFLGIKTPWSNYAWNPGLFS